MKIKSITFDHSPRIPGLRAGDLLTVDCETPGETLKDWRVVLRGPTLYLISPPGWCTKPRTQWNPKGPALVVEVPREHCSLQWFADDPAEVELVMKGGKYDTQPPLGWKPAPPPEEAPLLAQIPAHEMGDA